MPLESGSEPFRWWVIDGHIRPCLRAEDIPPASSDVWEAKYTADCERGKRTTRDMNRVPYGVSDTIRCLRQSFYVNIWSQGLGYEVEDDPTMHGGGLHVTSPGGVLATHLDYAKHPKLPDKRRALNLIAFMHPEWKSEWGGALVLCNPMGEVVKRIEAVPGRLAAFEVSDLSYHGVEKVTGPAERVTCAVYYLAPARPTDTRQRAMFLPVREPAACATISM